MPGDRLRPAERKGGPPARGGECQPGEGSSQVEEMSVRGGRGRLGVEVPMVGGGARLEKASCRDLGLRLELQQNPLAAKTASCEV